MTSDFKTGDGRNNRLLGRRNIHNHPGCPFWNNHVMGRYGLNTVSQQEQDMCSVSHEGTDEIDNVMSKFARASSPITTRKNYRRNSFNPPNKLRQNYTDESDGDSNILSKSSPAILSLNSCCSEEAEGANSTGCTNKSANSSSQSRLNHSKTNNRFINESAQNETRNIHANFSIEQPTNKGSKNWVFVPIIIALASIAYYIFSATMEETSNIIYDKLSFYNEVKYVGNKYKVSDNSILQVRAGIATIFEKQDTGSFIFPYNSGRRDFNSVDFNNFVNEIASAAAKYLRNDTKTPRHVVVDTSQLEVQSDKELMEKYIKDVDETGVMLVKDLDNIPSAMAMAFHYYCDEFNPLVKKSAIFFTLNIARCSNVSNEKYTHKIIEKCLAQKWIKMPQENIGPLLTRVVNVVIDVTSDF